MRHVNPWSFCKIRYFMDSFSEIGMIFSPGARAPKWLNDALWLKIELFTKMDRDQFSLSTFFLLIFCSAPM